MFSHQFITGVILITAFLTGYVYARLSRDEFARRRAYIRYTNFMILFDRYSKVYEEKWDAIKQEFIKFDHTYYLWRLKTMKLAEWKIGRKLEKELIEK